MTYFRSLHSHLQVLSKEDLKGTRIEHGFKRAFMSLFSQDVDTFTNAMLLNVDQLQKQLDKDEFQEDGSLAAFWVINRQFQKFINSQLTLGYDSQMTDKYFVEYTGIEVKHFRDTLLQHMGNVKKSVGERTRHQRQYKRRAGQGMIQMLMSDIIPILCRRAMAEKPIGKVDSQMIDYRNMTYVQKSQASSQAAETVTTSNELDVLFGPLFDEYFNEENQVVLKSSSVNTTDVSNKRQQQPDSTSSTSTLATTVTANGNF
ncbi:hypothetical protein Tco_1007430 [Tanacetum coccineum]